VRPAYLELEESTPGRFEVLFKLPLASGLPPLPLYPRLTPPCGIGEVRQEIYDDAAIERWSFDCGGAGLEGRVLRIEGLERTLTDTLVLVRFADGEEIVTVLPPDAPHLRIERSRGVAVWAYLRLGVEHLLFGFDHVLFVIGLLFLVKRPIELVAIVTAFTVAHSITLSLSVLDLVRLAPSPVEAAIALTILFLAVELLEPAERRSRVLARYPWLVAFGFGLLHGFGFAGALGEIGLPPSAIGPALVLFNLGVELGQLLVVAAVLIVLALIRWRGVIVPASLARAPIWVMGTLSASWFVERVARILG
jgi:hypothetical protein